MTRRFTTQPVLLRTPETFPWPAPAPGATEGSAGGITTAMHWPDLDLQQRAVAVFVGDGALTGTPDSIRALAARLGIPESTLVDILWDLLECGFMARVASWWAR